MLNFYQNGNASKTIGEIHILEDRITAKLEIDKYLIQERKTGIANTSLLHSFVDDFANRYEPVAKQQADFLGFDLDADSNLTFTPQLPESNGSKQNTESTDSS